MFCATMQPKTGRLTTPLQSATCLTRGSWAASRPRPSEVVRKFWSLYAESPKAATDYFYKLSQDCNYIRRDRIAKDEHWTAQYEIW